MARAEASFLPDLKNFHPGIRDDLARRSDTAVSCSEGCWLLDSRATYRALTLKCSTSSVRAYSICRTGRREHVDLPSFYPYPSEEQRLRLRIVERSSLTPRITVLYLSSLPLLCN